MKRFFDSKIVTQVWVQYEYEIIFKRLQNLRASWQYFAANLVLTRYKGIVGYPAQGVVTNCCRCPSTQCTVATKKNMLTRIRLQKRYFIISLKRLLFFSLNQHVTLLYRWTTWWRVVVVIHKIVAKPIFLKIRLSNVIAFF